MIGIDHTRAFSRLLFWIRTQGGERRLNHSDLELLYMSG
jgi:hypothetical protein